MSVGEREAQVRQRAVIGLGRHEYVGVLPIPYNVSWARVGAANPMTLRLRYRLGGWRACDCPRSKQAADRCRGQHIPT
jgi:hypothetical protein